KNRIQDSGFRIESAQTEAPVRPHLLSPQHSALSTQSSVLSTQHSVLSTQHSKGFTLVEMIIVIVITGIIGGMVAMFIRAPVQGYVDSARRAEMTDIADTALRRLGRDLRTAVPNSVRLPTPAGSTYIEFLPTRDGGRYRVANVGAGACGASGNELSFDAVDTCFEIIGSPMDFTAGDAIVIGSTQSDGSLPYQDVTSLTGVRRIIAAVGVGADQQAVRITSTQKFPDSAELEGHRFEVVPADQQAVTYACIDMAAGVLDANQNGQGSLVRYWHYDFLTGQPAPPPASATSAVLAQNVSGCTFVYNSDNQSNSLVAVSLTITRGNESVNLYHEVHINNIP
ncbi:MAG: prepilin-type N-terminal cleavage/methylation domain-containing protein, partial [Gallionellaceae bacterium]|nr:prepilin-type N-terminal cleavage/methylation domain-containing protein [Gallionellaceae bacterium]